MKKALNQVNGLTEWYNPRQRFFDERSSGFASEIREILRITDSKEFEQSLQRTFQTLHALGISFDHNFRKVFRFDGEIMMADWKVSPLAAYLIIINCDPSHELVARAQLFFVLTRNQYANNY